MLKALTIVSIFILIFQLPLQGQTNGKLEVSITTSKFGGEYAPRNIVAFWIEDESGKFVKTLLAYADKRKNYLTNWKNATNAAMVQYNVVDAVTAATQNSHDTRTCYWDGTDFDKKITSDGKYYLCAELTDKNGTGNFSKFEFTKSNSPFNITPANSPSFSSISIKWSPEKKTNNKQLKSGEKPIIKINSAQKTIHVSVNELNTIEIYNLMGQKVAKNNNSIIAINSLKNGIYLIKVSTKHNKYFERIYID